MRVPKENVLAEGDEAHASLFGAFTFGNMGMALYFTGVARASYDLTIDYVHERKQGGVVLIKHQSVRGRLFNMFRQVEAGRALARRVASNNFSSNGSHMLASMAAKTFVTQGCYEVETEATQLFGALGFARTNPIEKILRDAHASLVEDGENTILSLMGGSWLNRAYEASHSTVSQ